VTEEAVAPEEPGEIPRAEEEQEEEQEVVHPDFVFGRAETLEDLGDDLVPIPFKLYGYELEPPHQEHVFVFHARPTEPFGGTLDIFRKMDDNGNIPSGVSIQYIYDCLMLADQKRWDETLHRADLTFKGEALGEMARALLGHYSGGRPTSPRPKQPAGPRHTGRITAGARSAKGSRSRPSIPRTPSTSS
jgi:hypothetical protein